MTEISFSSNGRTGEFPVFQWLIMALFVAFSMGCSSTRNLKEGIAGKVLWFQGDLMPGIDKKPVEGTPVRREIFIYEPTLRTQTDPVDQVFYSNVGTKLIKKTVSDKKGNFTVALEPGKYSVFIKESQWLFATRISSEGFLNLVEVPDQEVAEIEIRIDYMAAY